MKRVSCKMFFSVVWKGVCQALGWFFGLFGYKREGKFAHCIWGLFAVSATVLVTIVAWAAVNALWDSYYYRHRQKFCDWNDCYASVYLSSNVIYHSHGNEEGEVINVQTGEKMLTDVDWISEPIGEKDSLVFYSDGKKRGYFNKYTGEVTIPAKYTHAWVFSGGIASVEENGVIKFINSKGQQVFDRTLPYNPNAYDFGYVFHGGYCIIDSDNDDKYGLMDTKGKNVTPETYDEIMISDDAHYWALKKGNDVRVLDQSLKTVLQLADCATIWLMNDEINVSMCDNTIRKYDYQGHLIDDFYIASFDPLEYETEETYQTKETFTDDDGEEHVSLSEPIHKKARARLCRYNAGNGMVGLITADGHMLTMPKYEDITAVGPDTYLCTVSHGDKKIVNGKGQEVK